MLEDHTDIFEIKPKEGQGALAASIVIKNSSKIDYDFGQRSYSLRVRFCNNSLKVIMKLKQITNKYYDYLSAGRIVFSVTFDYIT